MKKIAIIGGGIIGMTLANYLDPQMKGSAKGLKRAPGLFPLGYPNVGIRNGTN